MNIKTAGMILATAMMPMAAKTSKTLKTAEKVAPKIECVASKAAVALTPEMEFQLKNPIVGMEYGTFESKRKMFTGIKGLRREYHAEAPEGNDDFWSCYELYDKDNNKKMEACFVVSPTTKKTGGYLLICDTNLQYIGNTFNPTKGDYKNSRIMGIDSIAIDMNGNGIVDKNELMPMGELKKRLGTADRDDDEKRFGLNLAVTTRPIHLSKNPRNPEVGMRFGEYINTLNIRAQFPEAGPISTTSEVDKENGKIWVYNKVFFKNSLDEMASGVLMYNMKNKIRHFTLKEEGIHLKRIGATRKERAGNVKFSRIIGKESSAVDKNGNGIVDEGEIYPNNKPPFNDPNGYNDEKNFGLDLSVN